MRELERVRVESRGELRAWLAVNHSRSEGIWLVTVRKHISGRHGGWDAIVEEALCKGVLRCIKSV